MNAFLRDLTDELKAEKTAALCTCAAMMFFAFLYKYTLRAWFQEDDFAWLGLRLQVHNWSDLWHALFAPTAQGTIRPLS